MSVTFYGYCETAYASEEPYCGGRAEDAIAAQVSQIINAADKINGQVILHINATDAVNSQVLMAIVDEPAVQQSQVSMFVLDQEEASNAQVERVIKASLAVSFQVGMIIVDELAALLAQGMRYVVDREDAALSQVTRNLGLLSSTPSQVSMSIVAALDALPSQIMRYVSDRESAALSQTQMEIDKQVSSMSQAELRVSAQLNAKTQVEMFRNTAASLRTQVALFLEDQRKIIHGSVLLDKLAHHAIAGYCEDPYCGVGYCSYRMGAYEHMQVSSENKRTIELSTQVEAVVKKDSDRHVQVATHIVDHLLANPTQVYNSIISLNPMSTQALRSINRVIDHHTQIQRVIRKEDANHSQVFTTIRELDLIPAQVLQIVKREIDQHTQIQMVIHKQVPIHLQTQMMRGDRTSVQVTAVIYNTRRLRFMDVFPSRGTAALLGNNWSSYPYQSNPDFSPNNVNTDVPEQIFRSPYGTSAFVTLTCDSGLPQGVFLDTLAILNHNLTRGAVVSLQGSNDNFATTGVNIPIEVTTGDIYYISPSLPHDGWRYWRLTFIDNANPDMFVRVGIVLFGAARIFTMSENFVQPLISGLRDFKDVMATEGYTNVSNDRALRKNLRLQFENLALDRQNYQQLDTVFQTARTTSKVLWIPTPYNPERYSVFAKLTQLPDMTVISNAEDGGTDYLTFSIEVDESL